MRTVPISTTPRVITVMMPTLRTMFSALRMAAA